MNLILRFYNSPTNCTFLWSNILTINGTEWGFLKPNFFLICYKIMFIPKLPTNSMSMISQFIMDACTIGITLSKSFLWWAPTLHMWYMLFFHFQKEPYHIFCNWGKILINFPNLTSIFLLKFWSFNNPSNFLLGIFGLALESNYYSTLIFSIAISLHDHLYLLIS
jgi:hypothetical protein